MDKYEYRVISYSSARSDSSIKNRLNKAGKKGWELVSTYPEIGDYIRYFFKRKINNESQETKA